MNSLGQQQLVTSSASHTQLFQQRFTLNYIEWHTYINIYYTILHIRHTMHNKQLEKKKNKKQTQLELEFHKNWQEILAKSAPCASARESEKNKKTVDDDKPD